MSYKSELEERYRLARARMGIGVKAPVVHRMLIAPGGVSGSTGVAPPMLEKPARTPNILAAHAALAEQTVVRIANETKLMPKMIALPEDEDTSTLGVWRRVVKGVADRHDVSFDDILGTDRSRAVVKARFEAMYRMRVELGMSYPKIALKLGRDHSSVMHGVRVMHNRLLDEAKKFAHDTPRCDPAGMPPVIVEARIPELTAVA